MGIFKALGGSDRSQYHGGNIGSKAGNRQQIFVLLEAYAYFFNGFIDGSNMGLNGFDVIYEYLSF